MSKRTPYAGDLTRPMAPLDGVAWDKEWDRKLRILLDHYNISEDLSSGDFDLFLPHFRLLAKLIFEHVPGMSSEAKRGKGRSKKWTSPANYKLVFDVDAAWARDPTASQVTILRRLLGSAASARNVRSLGNRLGEARNDPNIERYRELRAIAGRNLPEQVEFEDLQRLLQPNDLKHHE